MGTPQETNCKKLSQHQHEQLTRKRTQLAPGIYAFVGYSSSNFAVIASKNGYILIDSGDSISGAKDALLEIKKLVSGPLQAIILTHSHPDHRGGASVFLEGRNDVPIWGHEHFGSEQKAGKGLEKIGSIRAGKQFGAGIPDDKYCPNFMLPRFEGSVAGPLPLVNPNTFVLEDLTAVNIDGVNLELHRIPGETTDHVVVWLPEQKVLFSGDHVYRSFPNLYPVRGGLYRDVEQWAKAVRSLMAFKPQAIMFGHNDVAIVDEIQPLLENYAQAIEYVYAETLKGMDQGLTPDELALNIQLPEHLRNKPYLGEYYGAIAWAVRAIYAYKLGWFDGNPTNLVRLNPAEEASRMANLSGGKAQLTEAAQKALRDEDYSWAAQLADYLITLGEDATGKAIKADALEALAKEMFPMAGKNYLVRSALDLRKNNTQ